MMLALDTANFKTTVALGLPQKTLAFYQSDQGADTELIRFLTEIFNSFDPKDIKSIAVTLGPGSFTGTRIGIAAARAFSLALDIPLYPLTSFEWVTSSYKLNGNDVKNPLVVALESQREEKFIALYSPSLIPIKVPQYLAPTDLSEFLGEIEICEIIGNAAADFRGENRIITAFMPTAEDLIQCVFEKQQLEEKFALCTPFYLRSPEINLGKPS